MLLDAARACVERLGPGRAGLTDVASEAGVTRQTVYRYFSDADDLFRSAAAISSGGFLERLRARVNRKTTFTDRLIECMVFAICELPRDKHLGPLVRGDDTFGLTAILGLGFVQEEAVRLSDGAPGMDREQLDELAELLLRLLRSFLDDQAGPGPNLDPGPTRTEAELRAVLRRWLLPLLDVTD